MAVKRVDELQRVRAWPRRSELVVRVRHGRSGKWVVRGGGDIAVEVAVLKMVALRLGMAACE